MTLHFAVELESNLRKLCGEIRNIRGMRLCGLKLKFSTKMQTALFSTAEKTYAFDFGKKNQERVEIMHENAGKYDDAKICGKCARGSAGLRRVRVDADAGAEHALCGLRGTVLIREKPVLRGRAAVAVDPRWADNGKKYNGCVEAWIKVGQHPLKSYCFNNVACLPTSLLSTSQVNIPPPLNTYMVLNMVPNCLNPLKTA